jgi:hypothetical protein
LFDDATGLLGVSAVGLLRYGSSSCSQSGSAFVILCSTAEEASVSSAVCLAAVSTTFSPDADVSPAARALTHIAQQIAAARDIARIGRGKRGELGANSISILL